MENLREMVSGIRENTRKRFTTKYTSLSGGISSSKNQNMVWFESSLERDFAIIQEFNPHVSKYIEQPFTIDYYYNGKERSYTPDFLVYFKKDLQPWLCEIKMSVDLELKKDELRPKFEAAKSLCNDENLKFKIFTENEIRTPYLENIKFLNQYESHFTSEPCVKLVIDRVKDLGLTSIGELLTSFEGSNRNILGKLIYAMWYLIKSNIIACDLRMKLSKHSEIWYNYE